MTTERDLLAMDAVAVQAGLPNFSAAELEALVRRANAEYWDKAAPSLPDASTTSWSSA